MRPLAGLLVLMVCAVTPAHAQDIKAPESCVKQIEAVLDDIRARDLDATGGPPLNAFVALNENALAQAAELDRKVAQGGEKGPLHCLPVAVKDNFDTADMPVTVGSRALIGNRPPGDATLVARMRQAGAIVVGKTNMDEFAMGIRGLSGATGRTGNAYDTWFSPGGSSAGSGAAVGAGFVPLALGSDNCGSLRIPAVYNGAVSLRPTYGRFPVEGVFPIGFVNGVSGAIAKDVPMLRSSLAVMDARWSRSVADAGNGLRGKRIGILRTYNGKDFWAKASPEMKMQMTQAIARMKDAGAVIVDPVVLNGFDDRLGIEFLKGFAVKVDREFSRYDGPRKTWRDVCRSGLIRAEWTERQCVADGASAPRRERAAVRRIAANRETMVRLMNRLKLDAIVYPTDLRGGAREDASDDITCYLAGSAGLPAAAAPAGTDSRGMPVGIEWLGRPGADEQLVAMMAAFEKARGPLPAAKRGSGQPALAKLPLSEQNQLRLTIGERAFKSRTATSLGDLEARRFRALTDEVTRSLAP
ncbi:amidase [Pseudorhodoplanes sp.]|uniref:amidase n=1 Tax=Pseudorhodoplanes sp. TaxID=1934341 RepID=UPI00391A1C5D